MQRKKLKAKEREKDEDDSSRLPNFILHHRNHHHNHHNHHTRFQFDLQASLPQPSSILCIASSKKRWHRKQSYRIYNQTTTNKRLHRKCDFISYCVVAALWFFSRLHNKQPKQTNKERLYFSLKSIKEIFVNASFQVFYSRKHTHTRSVQHYHKQVYK